MLAWRKAWLRVSCAFLMWKEDEEAEDGSVEAAVSRARSWFVALRKEEERSAFVVHKSFSKMIVSVGVQKTRYAAGVRRVGRRLDMACGVCGGVFSDINSFSACLTCWSVRPRLVSPLLRGTVVLGSKKSRRMLEMLGRLPRRIMSVFQ